MTYYASVNYMNRTINLNLLTSLYHMTDEEISAEQQLVLKAQRDESSFSSLYDRYFDGVFGFVFRRTDDENTAGDITSQVFLRALQNLKKYEFRGLPFSALLYRIASNEINKYYRKKKRTIIFSLEEERIRDLIDEADEESKEIHIKLLVDSLNEMPTEVVEVLELRFFEEKGFKEIAFILNISESGAKMRTYRALEKLKVNFNIKIKDHGEA